jgi:hypothetical protein
VKVEPFIGASCNEGIIFYVASLLGVAKAGFLAQSTFGPSVMPRGVSRPASVGFDLPIHSSPKIFGKAWNPAMGKTFQVRDWAGPPDMCCVEYRRNAEACLRLALASADSASKNMFVDLAQAWLRLAEKAEAGLRNGRGPAALGLLPKLRT